MSPLQLLRAALRTPGMWGVLALVLVIVGLLAVRAYRETSIRSGWEGFRTEREREARTIVQRRFDERVGELASVARGIAGDAGLRLRLLSRDETDVQQAFEELERRRPADVHLDIVDPLGNIVAWAGRSVMAEMRWDMPQVEADTLPLLVESNLHTYLSVVVPFEQRSLFCIASKALEVNYPISNRFVQPASFSAALSDEVGLNVRLIVGSELAKNGIPITRPTGDRIGSLIVAPPTLEGEIARLRAWYDTSTGVAGGLASLLFFLVLFRLTRQHAQRAGGLILTVVLLWLVRYLWLLLDFPSSLLNGPLFDPVLYGSVFGFGLTSSLGETLLTALAFGASVFLLWRYFWQEGAGRVAVSSWTGGWPRALLVLPVFALLAILLVQAYSEAIRSFVFDSTLQFHDPTSLLPTTVASVMYVVILILSLSAVALASLLLLVMAHLGRHLLARRTLDLQSWLVVVAVLLAVLGLYFVVLPVKKFLWWHAVILFMAGGSVAWWKTLLSQREAVAGSFLRTAALVVLAALVVAVPVLDHKLHLKDREQLQLLAGELVRPVDSWLSFVIADGLRTISSVAPEEIRERRQTRTGSGLAFTLWSQTLMGREGYNSAVVLYDEEAQEIGRFTVGLTSFEQNELLRVIFDANEEAVQVIDRTVPGGTLKYYGAWGTLRTDENRLFGYVAIALSESQEALFRGEVPEPLLGIARDRFERHLGEITVSEYQDGVVTTTNNREKYLGMPLGERVRERLADPRTRMLWDELRLGEKRFEVLYVRDESRPGTIVALTIEPQDIRWHLFNLIKLLLVFFAVLAAVVAGHLVARWGREHRITVGFRERLLAAFAVLAAVPLVGIAYYNRQVARESLEASITRRLAEDLNLLEQRLRTAIADDDDFIHGVNDDFCEMIASDLGVDFSVFRGAQLHASSKPELYQSAILDPRLGGEAYANTVLLNRAYYQGMERIGTVEYAVGYKPIVVGGRRVGIAAVPALYRQHEIDEELARRNVYGVAAYVVVLAFVFGVGLVMANRLSRPLRELREAVHEVGRGNLAVRLQPTSDDEVGEVMKAFNEMVQELKEGREQAARFERESAWKEMARQVAHEIKNPLTPMRLAMQHLRQAYRDRAKNLDDIVESVTQTVVEQVDALSRIASEFSDFARMPERRFERVNLHDVLSDTIRLFQEVEGIEFRTQFSDTAPVLVADREELRRVFINLVRNSVQAMEKGGRITVTTEITDRHCLIRIADTGPGIPESIQKKVFQPYFSTKTDGTGLGLAICRRIIEDLDGSIDLTSTMGVGTTVEIRLPLQFSFNE